MKPLTTSDDPCEAPDMTNTTNTEATTITYTNHNTTTTHCSCGVVALGPAMLPTHKCATTNSVEVA